MQKVWFKNYPKEVPHEIDPDQYASLSVLFEEKVAKNPDKIAYINTGISMTYRQLEEHSRHFANFLLQNLQLNKGDRVGIMLPNLLQFPVAVFGILRAGLIAVNLNPLYTSAELQPILRDANLQTILVLSQFAHVIERVTASVPLKNIIITEVGDLFPTFKRVLVSFFLKYIKHSIPNYHLSHAISFRQALAFGKMSLFTPCPIAREDIAFLQYTGGTTGLPKGVMLTHRNILANIAQCLAWVNPVLSEEKEIFVTALPLYHVFSLMANGFIPLCLGATNILITNPRDTKRFIEEIAHSRFTVITGVNTLYNLLLNQSDFIKHVDFSGLKIALSGGMALQKSVADKWQQVTGKPLLEAYGLSEASPGISMLPVTNTDPHNGTAGLPWPSTEIDIRNESNQSLDINEIGNIWIRGPQVMKGYWNNSEATTAVLSADGWLDTGDIGKIDEQGYLSIVDRKKDMIIISGFNVYPIEIENVIASHPRVQEVAVIGVRDKQGNEIIKAFIVKKGALTRNKIIAYCKAYLTPYKIPHIVTFVDSLPKSNVGKVLKRALREMP